MTVLLVIAALIAVTLVVWFINYSNEYSQREYGYEIFTLEEFIVYVIAYAFLYFGYNWFEKALHNGGDTLNGILLMVIGCIMIVMIILASISETSVVYGISMGAVKMALYAIATPVVILILFILGAWVMNTKPVIRLDD